MLHQIVTIGNNLESTLLGLKEYGPDFVYFLLTEETDDLCVHLKQMLPRSITVREYTIEPYDGAMIEQLCETIRKEHCQKEGDRLTYNLSEGTNIMVLAASRVASRYGDYAFYLTQDRKIINIHTYESEDLAQSMDNDEFISVYGNRLNSYQDIDALRQEDVSTAIAIKSFIETKPIIYKKISYWYRTHINDAKESLPDKVEFSNGQIKVLFNQGTVTIIKDNVTVFQSLNPKTVKLMFEGRWWEIIICDIIRMWNDSCHPDADIWRSVIFQNEDDEAVKNEIDIIANDETRLLIIECKSGHVDQDDIYKVHSVRETYGGEDSKAILVSYYPLDESIKDKCDDLHICYFAPDTYLKRVNHYFKLQSWLNEITKENEI